MQTVAVHPTAPKQSRIDLAADVLRSGGVVALPTETFYGLAADATQPQAVAKLNRLKQKDVATPTLLLAADSAQARSVALTLPDGFDEFADAFWPGPLTLILPRAAHIPDEVTGGGETVGVRVPGLLLPQRIAAALGSPITGVSANLHREPAPRTAAEVAASFDDRLDLILDAGPTPGGAPSSLIDLTQDPPRLLREGILRREALERVRPLSV